MSVHDGVVVQTTLDPLEQPFLNHHRIDGTPVLPGVMGMEAFAETARLLAPDYHVIAVEDVGFNAPLKFYRDEPRELTVTAIVRPDGSDLVADCELAAERVLPGSATPQRTVHFTGKVRLSASPPTPTTSKPVTGSGTPSMDSDQVYSFYFHGPAYQVVESAWNEDGSSVAALADPLPDNHVPNDLPLTTAPRLVELCFQAAGLWQAGREDRLALPMRVDSAQVLIDPSTAKGALHARADEIEPGVFDCVVVDAEGTVVVRLDGYRTIGLPVPIPDKIAADLQAIFRS